MIARAPARAVYHLGIRSQLSGRADHVLALIGQRGRRGVCEAEAPAPSPHLARASLLAAVPLNAQISTLAMLGLAAGILVAMVAYEVSHYAEARDRVRHQPLPGA